MKRIERGDNKFCSIKIPMGLVQNYGKFTGSQSGNYNGNFNFRQKYSKNKILCNAKLITS